ncbi:hypothetical protein HI914_02933 [Erysiphe necator]|nr:hypothetical protein HI914_02933 [Erysiphe necator]
MAKCHPKKASSSEKKMVDLCLIILTLVETLKSLTLLSSNLHPQSSPCVLAFYLTKRDPFGQGTNFPGKEILYILIRRTVAYRFIRIEAVRL